MLTVTNIRRELTEFCAELRARIICEEDPALDNTEVWLRYPAEHYENLSLNANPFVAALLLTAMRLGAKLKVEGAISRKIRTGINKFMEIMHQWRPLFYKPVKIEAAEITETFRAGRSVGSFFSGGVDSFYTLLKNENSDCAASEKTEYLIFVRGFDIRLDCQNELYREALRRVDAAGAALGKKVIQVSTNIRKMNDHLVPWDWFHGQAMMSVALGLDGLLRKIYIPSTHTYQDLFPWGSHPLLDPLWATESLEVVHDGCEATRVEKIIEEIANSQVALDNLRVCCENRYERFNCGVCEKCVRTMVNLEVAGVLERCNTFDRKLNYARVKNLFIENENVRAFVQENYDTLATRGGNPQLLNALSKCLSPYAGWRPRNIVRSLVPKRALRAVKSLIIAIDQRVLQGRVRDLYRKKYRR